jgi:hypothetical protein
VSEPDALMSDVGQHPGAAVRARPSLDRPPFRVAHSSGVRHARLAGSPYVCRARGDTASRVRRTCVSSRTHASEPGAGVSRIRQHTGVAGARVWRGVGAPAFRRDACAFPRDVPVSRARSVCVTVAEVLRCERGARVFLRDAPRFRLDAERFRPRHLRFAKTQVRFPLTHLGQACDAHCYAPARWCVPSPEQRNGLDASVA